MDQLEEDKIKSSTIKCCNREYKIIHYKKNNVNNILNYFGLAIYIIKKYINQIIIPLINYTEIIDMIGLFLKINIFFLPFYLTFAVVAIIIGLTEHSKVYQLCHNNFRHCDTYKKFCYDPIDDIYYNETFYETRKNDILLCIDNNLYVFDFIKSAFYDFTKFLYNMYCYMIPIYGCLYYGYYISIYMIEKINNMYNKTVIYCKKELPIVEEV